MVAQLAGALVTGAFAAVAGADATAASRWNALLIESIRHDFARPPVHARNLYHTSAAMWDAWRAFGGGAPCYVNCTGDPGSGSIQAAREQAISTAAYRMLVARFTGSPGLSQMKPQYDALLQSYGVSPTDTHDVGNDPVAVGNRIAASIIAGTYEDGANQAGNYANRVYAPVNPAMVVAVSGNPNMPYPSRWQPLALNSYVDQQGNVIPTGFPAFQAAEWGWVTPFGMRPDADRNYHLRDSTSWPVWMDPGAPPEFMGAGNASFRKGMEVVLRWSAHLDPADGVMWDISPGTMGASPEPTDPTNWQPYYDIDGGRPLGTGRAVNPATGLPYATNVVPRGDFTRALAEFWADGPTSETPPGHWFSILNSVRNNMTSRRIGGRGPQLDQLEWDVKAYLLLGGAMHDAAVAAWSAKGAYDGTRPINSIRYMTNRGQDTNPGYGSFSVSGIDLVPDRIELVTAATAAPGGKHENLGTGQIGQIAVRAWRGPSVISNPATDVAGVGWILGRLWHPYQRPTFVTPPFAGWVSGHSTYSRTAAEVLTALTGDAYFPGGVGEFLCPRNAFLVFEAGPSVDVRLQWATYRDAAEQSAMSRIWGGIHPPFDDQPGRAMGRKVASRAWQHARDLWQTPVSCDADLTGDGRCDGADLGLLLAAWGPAGEHPAPDLNGDGVVDGADLGLMLSAWGSCVR
jgi:hypothetical protein